MVDPILSKKSLIKLFTEGVFQPFKQMVYGSHWAPCDGWRKSKHGDLLITFEKNPSGGLIYTDTEKYELTEYEIEDLIKIFGK